ncbi:MAG: hypothetical protein KDE56_04030 [Anaerolineales bacterium]|nr:hypothetical protein [Anaerolineales bacterium]
MQNLNRRGRGGRREREENKINHCDLCAFCSEICFFLPKVNTAQAFTTKLAEIFCLFPLRPLRSLRFNKICQSISLKSLSPKRFQPNTPPTRWKRCGSVFEAHHLDNDTIRDGIITICATQETMQLSTPVVALVVEQTSTKESFYEKQIVVSLLHCHTSADARQHGVWINGEFG